MKEKIIAEIERRMAIVNNVAIQIQNKEKREHYSNVVEEYKDLIRFIKEYC